jgi:hypothetical protein
LAEIVKRVVPGCEVAYANRGGPDRRDYRVDFSKIARLVPAFRPRWDVTGGAGELYTVYLARGLSEPEFQGRKYSRLKQLNHLREEGRLDEALCWTARADSGRR